MPNKNLWVVYISFHVGFWLLLELVKNIGKKENQQIPTSMWLLLSLIAAASCIVIASLQLNLWRRDDPYLLSTEIPVLLAFLIINVALFILFDRFSELLKRDREQSLLRQQLFMQNEHSKQLAAYQDQIASLHHDMTNPINAAVSLVQTIPDNRKC